MGTETALQVIKIGKGMLAFPSPLFASSPGIPNGFLPYQCKHLHPGERADTPCGGGGETVLKCSDGLCSCCSPYRASARAHSLLGTPMGPHLPQGGDAHA